MRIIIIIFLLFHIASESQVTRAHVVSSTLQGGDSGSPPIDPNPPDGPVVAFPGAEGFGKNATGGRSGTVVFVTNLNNSGAGSFRAACDMTVPRTIIFRVGGTINLSSDIRITGNEGNVTIAGQTAPGGGILLRNYGLSIETSNVVVRYLRIRGGGNGNGDNIRIKSFGSSINNIIIDHCSVSWPTDGNLDVSTAHNVTVQWSLIGEGDKNMLCNIGSYNISYLNNAILLNNQRNIRSNTAPPSGLMLEMQNNIVYGFNWGAQPTWGVKLNIVGNRFEDSDSFSASCSSPVGAWVVASPSDNDTGELENSRLYVDDNFYDTAEWGSLYYSSMSPYVFGTPLTPSDYTPTASSGLDAKLLSTVGASLPARDAVDTRLINSYNAKTGTLAYSGTFPSIANGTPYTDSDNDGMDDSWETSMFGDLDETHNGDHDDDGYTNLEEFLNSIDN